MPNRYKNRRVITNTNKNYEKYFETRDIKRIEQYATPKYFYFTEEQLNRISYIEHVWSAGDRLYKLSARYLGSHEDWWILLRFNKLKNEVDIKAGDVIKIPLNVADLVLLMMG